MHITANIYKRLAGSEKTCSITGLLLPVRQKTTSATGFKAIYLGDEVVVMALFTNQIAKPRIDL